MGAVEMVDEPEPDHNGCPTVRTIPYVVALDDRGKLISVPEDSARCIRPEVCWTEAFTDDGPLPPVLVKRSLRFAIGDHVTCLVDDGTQRGCNWENGIVSELWAQREAWGTEEAAAYAIQLDGSGDTVLAHRDDHCLVRDADLQPAGPNSRRNASRFGKRQRAADGQWEDFDHQTRVVRVRVGEPERPSLVAAPAAPAGSLPYKDEEGEAEALPAWAECGMCE